MVCWSFAGEHALLVIGIAFILVLAGLEANDLKPLLMTILTSWLRKANKNGSDLEPDSDPGSDV
jgi:hypothetical protein